MIPFCPGVPWTPRKVSGLTLWLKADAGITLSGTDVTAWDDQSGLGNGAAATGGPQFVASAINGLPGVDFGVAGCNVHQSATQRLVGLDAARHVFVVAKARAGGSYEYGGNLFAVPGPGAGDRWVLRLLDLPAGTHHAWANEISINSTRDGISGLDTPLIQELAHAGGTGSGKISCSINGTAATLSSTTKTEETDGYGYSVGNTTADIPFYGSICEVLFYAATLAAGDITRIRAYLSTRYAIEVA
jgi:hypothetical protein